MQFQILWTLMGVFLSVVWDSADAEDIAVHISGSSVILTCPQTEPNQMVTSSSLKKGGIVVGDPLGDNRTYLLKNYSEQNDGEYECTVNQLTSKLYLKAKVCDNCVDMGFWTVAGVVVSDLMVTLGVVILVYYWSKNRKGSPSGGTGGAAGRRPREYKTERPPPVPNPDYEPIRKGQRDVYDGLKPAF